MAQQRKPTPEEQLLKLIENPSEHAAQDAGAKGVSAKPRKQPGKKGGWFGGGAGLFSLKKKEAAQGQPAVPAGPAVPVFSIKLANRMLLVLVFAAAIYLILDLFIFPQDEGAFLAQVSTTDAVFPVQEPPQTAPERGLSFYKEALSKRNPFLPPEI